MATMIEKVINDLMKINGGQEDELIVSLRAKSAELGDDPSDEEVAEAVHACIMEHLGRAFQPGDDVPFALDEEDTEYMEKAGEVVKDFLEENDWHYTTREPRPDLTLYELAFGVRGINLRVRIHVETAPRVCRIEAVLPISADATYEYPLCKALASQNYPRRFGSFKYDERDGEITYEHSFITRDGICKEDFGTYFHAVIHAAISGYNDIRKCCVGRFKGRELSDILKKVNDLVSDLSE